MVWNQMCSFFPPTFYFGGGKKGKIPCEPHLVLLVHKMSTGTDGRVKLQRICLGYVMSRSAVYNISAFTFCRTLFLVLQIKVFLTFTRLFYSLQNLVCRVQICLNHLSYLLWYHFFRNCHETLQNLSQKHTFFRAATSLSVRTKTLLSWHVQND